MEATTSSKVLRTHATPPPDTIRTDVARLLAMATGADEPGLRAAILDYARGPIETSGPDESGLGRFGIHIGAPEITMNLASGEVPPTPVEVPA